MDIKKEYLFQCSYLFFNVITVHLADCFVPIHSSLALFCSGEFKVNYSPVQGIQSQNIP